MNWQVSRTTFITAAVVVVALALGVAGLMPALSQAEDGQRGLDGLSTVQSAVSETISYQGRLTDSNGEPLSGSFTMRFLLYNTPAGGTPLFDSGNQTVAVADGLFTVSLAVGQDHFDGQPLWLRIDVGDQTLTPRQEIRPAPYAMSLRPGAEIRQVATGTAVRVESTQGIGLQGTGQVYGVYGRTGGASMGSGYGGYFESDSGIGVMGRSTALPTLQNVFAPGVSGYSQHGVVILGQAATGFGIYGNSAGGGIGGVGQVYGVYGASAAPAQGSGSGGYFVSSTGIGVSGRSTAQSSTQNLYAPGVYGFSQNGAGVVGESGVGVGVFTIGNLVVTGSKNGYVVDVARNDGDEPLQQGDLVVVIGAAEPVLGDIPVPLVRKADSEASRAVIGVVDELYQPVRDDAGRFAADLINPGDYLTIVTLGAYKVIHVDATYGAIQPGDLLVSSPTPGHAMRADTPALGTVIGKALSGLESGTGAVPIMVTLQ